MTYYAYKSFFDGLKTECSKWYYFHGLCQPLIKTLSEKVRKDEKKMKGKHF